MTSASHNNSDVVFFIYFKMTLLPTNRQTTLFLHAYLQYWFISENVKGTVHPKSKTHSFPLTCGNIYPFRLFRVAQSAKKNTFEKLNSKVPLHKSWASYSRQSSDLAVSSFMQEIFSFYQTSPVNCITVQEEASTLQILVWQCWHVEISL